MCDLLDDRCDRCKHYIQGFSDDELALKMRRDWRGYCTANAPTGNLVPAGDAGKLPLQEYQFPIVAFNCHCAKFEQKEYRRN